MNDDDFRARFAQAMLLGLRYNLGQLYREAVAEEKRRPDLAGRYRNKPCPCGSGRKAKKCCLGRKPPR